MENWREQPAEDYYKIAKSNFEVAGLYRDRAKTLHRSVQELREGGSTGLEGKLVDFLVSRGGPKSGTLLDALRLTADLCEQDSQTFIALGREATSQFIGNQSK